MKLKKYLPKIDYTELNVSEFFNNRLSLDQIKSLLTQELTNLIDSDTLEGGTSKRNWKISSFSISTFLSTYWSIFLSFEENKGVNFFLTTDYFNYSLNQINSNVYLLNFYFKPSLFGYVDSVNVYVETDISYLQFSKDSSEFVDQGSGWKGISDNVYIYSQSSPETIIYVEFIKNNKVIYKIYLSDIQNPKYFVPFLSLEIYKISSNSESLNTYFPTFNKDLAYGGGAYYLTSVLLPISDSSETLLATLYYNDSFIQKHLKTYLPISFKNFPSARTYIYDLALSMLVLVAEYRLTLDDQYKNLLINMFNSSKRLLNSRNAFNFSYPSYTYYSDENIRNGAVAWMLEALAVTYNFINELQTTENKDYIKSIADYLISEIQPNGLIRGGYGRYVNNTFDPTYVVAWQSTEHNIDTYFALRSVYAITQEESYLTAANNLKSAIMNNLWNGERFIQGLNDDAGALDLYTWGSIFLYKTGADKNMIYSNIRYLDTYFRIKDFSKYVSPIIYKPYSTDLGYLGANNVLWFEGYFQAYYTKYLIYKQKKEFISESKKLSYFLKDNLFPYSIGKDLINEIDEYPALSSSCWYVFTYNLIYNNMESFWFLGDAIDNNPAM